MSLLYQLNECGSTDPILSFLITITSISPEYTQKEKILDHLLNNVNVNGVPLGEMNLYLKYY